MSQTGSGTEHDTEAALGDVTVVVIQGADPQGLAAAARTTARHAASGRRVAVFDLAGAFEADDDEGLVSALRDGRSLSTLARPLADDAHEWFVVGRGPQPADPSTVRHERWPKLIAGCRATGALLVILTPVDLPAADALLAHADRVVRLTTSAPPVAQPGRSAPQGSHDLGPGVSRRRPQRIGRWILLVAAGSGALWVQFGDRLRPPPAPGQEAVADSAARTSLLEAVVDAAPLVVPDTIAVPIVANPQDSAAAAVWGVEVVATNDRTDANFRLAAAGASLAAGTVSPLLLGSDPTPLYKVVGGAFVDFAAAERWRDSLRARGTLPPGTGRVERVPFAVRLAADLTLSEAKLRARAWTARGTAAYALVGVDGRAAVYAGAFATPDLAVLLLTALRIEAPDAVLAFRVGRSF